MQGTGERKEGLRLGRTLVCVPKVQTATAGCSENLFSVRTSGWGALSTTVPAPRFSLPSRQPGTRCGLGGRSTQDLTSGSASPRVCAHPTLARNSLPSAGHRTRSLSGRPWAETWGRPASEFPSLRACPPGTPARRPHLAPGGSRPASPPRSAPSPWPRAAAPWPPAPFREPPPGGQATPLRLPPPAAPPGTGAPGRPQAKCTKKPSWVSPCLSPLQCSLLSLFLGG